MPDQNTNKAINIAYFLEGLKEQRNYPYVLRSIREQQKALKENPSSNSVLKHLTVDHAKSFFISLALDTLGVCKDSDIVLCSWALLDGYQYGKELNERRKAYLLEREKYDPDYVYKEPFSSLSASKQKTRAEGLINIENRAYEKIDDFFNSIRDRIGYMESACVAFLHPSEDDRIISDRVLYPAPSYIKQSRRLTGKNPVAVSIRHLPIPRDPNFIGREDALAKLSEGFSRDERTIQILSGMGGVGKTQIALQYAHTHMKEYNAIIWLDATDSTSLANSCREFLRIYDPDVGNLDSTDEIRIEFLRYQNARENWLLILDNADYLGEDSEAARERRNALTSYLPTSNGHIMITTRCQSKFLEVKPIVIDVFSLALAHQYLEKITGLPIDASARVIAKELGYLPLALKYSANYIEANGISYHDYLVLWYIEGSNLLDQDNIDYAERTVRQAFHVSLKKIIQESPTEDNQVLHNLLDTCALMDMEYLPVDAYVSFIQKGNRELADSARSILHYDLEMPVFLKDENGHNLEFKIHSVLSDNTVLIRCVSDPSIGIIPFNPYEELSLLENKLRRTEIIRHLTSYSLADYVDARLIVHPLLRTIIRGEMDIVRKQNITDDIVHQFKSFLYSTCGDSELAKKNELAYLSNALDAVYDSDICDFESENHPGYLDRVLMDDMVNFSKRVISFGDIELIRKFFDYFHEMCRNSCNLLAPSGPYISLLKCMSDVHTFLAQMCNRAIMYYYPSSSAEPLKPFKPRCARLACPPRGRANDAISEAPLSLNGVFICIDEIDELALLLPILYEKLDKCLLVILPYKITNYCLPNEPLEETIKRVSAHDRIQ